MVWTVPTTGSHCKHAGAEELVGEACARDVRSASIGSAMVEPRLNDAALRRLNMAATVVITGAVVAAAAMYERRRIRWWLLVHPLATPKANLERVRLDLSVKRGNLLMAAAAAASAIEAARIIREASNDPS